MAVNDQDGQDDSGGFVHVGADDVVARAGDAQRSRGRGAVRPRCPRGASRESPPGARRAGRAKPGSVPGRGPAGGPARRRIRPEPTSSPVASTAQTTGRIRAGGLVRVTTTAGTACSWPINGEPITDIATPSLQLVWALRQIRSPLAGRRGSPVRTNPPGPGQELGSSGRAPRADGFNSRLQS